MLLRRRLAIDLLLWCCVPAAFIAIYILRYHVSSSVIIPHFRVVLAAWVFIVAIRLLVARLAFRESASQVISSGVLSLALMVAFAYYGVVLVGMDSWGQVISWDLIRSYTAQAPELADALDMSMFGAGAAIAVVYVLLLAAVWFLLRRYDWVWQFTRSTRPWLLALVMVSAPVMAVAEFYSAWISGAERTDEPVMLTILPVQGSGRFQDHTIDRLSSLRLDAAEDAARAKYLATPDPQPANVVLIVVDALRPDHMGAYGYARDTTPRLNRWLLETNGRLVRGVRATCSESACGLLSIASSKFVHQFSRRPITLHEVLRKHGYKAHMILGGDHTNFYGLRDAYGEVDSYSDGADARGYYANDDAFVVARTRALPRSDGTPIMLQFHLMSAHGLGKRHDESRRFLPSLNYAGLINRKPADHEAFVNHYDNGVVQADLIINELLEALEQRGYLQKALVVITADHGEFIGEHGLYSHANGVYDHGLRVPLILLSFGYERPPLLEREAASQVDIAPTILYDLGLPLPDTWAGTPLQQPDKRAFDYFLQKKQIGLVDRRDPAHLWKYWIDFGSGEHFAFDLNHDPQELHNAAHALTAAQEREWLSTLLRLRPVGSPGMLELERTPIQRSESQSVE
jgi:glucan phosphoethanolaminetransferase (alkaline phosphatase superfamily)